MFTRKIREFRAANEYPLSRTVLRLLAKGKGPEVGTRVLIATTALIAVVFYIAPSASALYETPNGARLNKGQTATLGATLSSDADGALHTPASGDLSILLNGANPLQEECGDSFSDPGATATNGAGKAVPVQVSGQVDSRTPGTYSLTYTAADDKDSTSVERIVIIVDTTPPEIALEGGNPMTVSCWETFAEPGASATDGCQGKVPVTISGSVDPNLPGTYTLSYTATDAHNNIRTVTRTVIVGGTGEDPPTVTINGDAEMTIECGGIFTDLGAAANTACAGSVPVATNGTVDVNTPGSYNVIYSASYNELTAEASRIIAIVDTTAPLISLKSSSPLTIVRGSVFTDPGGIAQDGCAGDFAATASGTVDPNTIGSYTITYTASDPSGNQATPVQRTVNVIDAASATAIHNPLWLVAVRLVSQVSTLGGF